jgi:serine/threonine protein phosphatase 1
MQALEKKGFEKENLQHHLIVCGDAFDRGREAKEMMNFLVELHNQGRLIYVRGNHEDLLLQMVHELPYIVDGIEYTHHASNGTVSTLLQLVGMSLSQMKRDPFRAQKYFYNTQFYKTLVPSLVDYAEIADCIFVHGWIPSFAHLDDFRDANEKEWREARWWNGMEMWRNKACRVEGKTIVCGHWNCSWGHAIENPNIYTEFGTSANWEPYAREGILAIDACTAYSGIINCVVLEI